MDNYINICFFCPVCFNNNLPNNNSLVRLFVTNINNSYSLANFKLNSLLDLDTKEIDLPPGFTIHRLMVSSKREGVINFESVCGVCAVSNPYLKIKEEDTCSEKRWRKYCDKYNIKIDLKK